jgi:hypothetical protein
MKYLCLGYYDAEKFDTLSGAEQEAIASECQPHDEALRKSGHLVAVASLQHRTAATLRPRNGKTSVFDGPFAEAKQVVGAFFIVEAKDLNEAIRVASMHPAAKCGENLGFAIEVRPIEMFEQL